MHQVIYEIQRKSASTKVKGITNIIAHKSKKAKYDNLKLHYMYIIDNKMYIGNHYLHVVHANMLWL